MQIQENISLKPYNTFGIDVRAASFVRFGSREELEEISTSDVFKRSRHLVLGGGSNVLFRGDFSGLVLKNEIPGIEVVKEEENHYLVKAGSGESWHGFVLHCIGKGYAGVENLALIPGCVGAAPMQNIGAYGVELKDVFHSLEAYHIHDRHLSTFTLADCRFGYRESVFKNVEKDRWIITSVT
ncbi:MAG: FAD-binding protein, partial [Flavobacteriales bacterium]|nr:FAD-binding protein [Flavobacteriales bacterium]